MSEKLPWVSVNDRLPRKGVEVLVCYRIKRSYGKGSIRCYELARRDDDGDWQNNQYYALSDVLYWCPLVWPRKVSP